MPTRPKLVVLGAACSGRGTLCALIRTEFDVVHLSSGEMLRAAVDDGGETGKKVKIYMERGQLVPDKLMVEIFLARIALPDCQSRGWVLDGFPKTPAQAKSFVDHGVVTDACISLEVSDDVLIDRCINRRTDPVTGTVYSLKYAPPTDENVRRRLVHRNDDTEEKIRPALQFYTENLTAILEKFTTVVKFNGNRTPKLLWYELKPRIDRLTKYLVVFVLGGPGSGKGTQCTKISQKFGYTHLSAGDLLREERNSGSETATMINDYIVQGKIVPAEVTINLLLKAMISSGNKKFLIDGFPRNIENMEAWYQIMEKKSMVDFVLFFDCPEPVMQERLLERGKTSGRNDDNVNTIIKRFQTFQVESMPVMRSFQRFGKVRVISAVPHPDVVFKYVSRLFTGLSTIQPYQRTIGIVKPDAVADGHVPAILEAINNANLTIILTKYVQLTNEAVYALFPNLITDDPGGTSLWTLTSGPALVILAEGTDAISRWKALLGHSNPVTAKQLEPHSLRARFGVSPTRNALYGSDNELAAIHEISLFCDPTSVGAATEIERVSSVTDDPVGIPLETTLTMIKPCSSETQYENIVSILALHGYEILSEMRMTLSEDQVNSFYAEHKGKAFFEGLKKYMTSGPIIALKLQRHAAIKGLRHLMGGAVDKCREERPECIRTLYGTDNTRNAIHGSDAAASAKREVNFFFNIGNGSVKTGYNGNGTTTSEDPLTSPTTNSSKTLSASSSLPSLKYNDDEEEDNFVVKAAKIRRTKMLPMVSSADRNQMAAFLSNNVDPIIRGLIERILMKKPKDVLSYAIQDLKEVQRLSVGTTIRTPSGRNILLEPLTSGTGSTAPSPKKGERPGALTAASGTSANIVSRGSSMGGNEELMVRIRDLTLAHENASDEVERLKSLTMAMAANIKEERRIAASTAAIHSDENKAQRRELIILHFNDIYDYEENIKENYGGAARFSWQMKNLSKDNPLIINSGDFLGPSTTSNVTNGAHMIQIMNCIGVNYGVLGNHDFDFGMEELKNQLESSTTTWICSNLIDPQTKRPVAGCEKDAIIHWNNVTVGILGLCEDWLSLCPKISSADVKYLDIFDTAEQSCRDLRRKGAEVIIAITHCRTIVDEELSRRVPEIDLILGGHDHFYSAWKFDEGTYAVKSGCDFRDISKVRITLKPDTDRAKVHWPPIRIGIPCTLIEDKDVKEICDYYANFITAKMKSPIAYTDVSLDGTSATVRTTESNLGNLVADIMREQYKADVAILNGGFIRSDSVLNAGFVTMGDISKFFPFPDILTCLEITGEELHYCLENGVSRTPAQDGRYCHLSGIVMKYDMDAPQKHRVLEVKVNGEPLDLHRSYSIAVNGFMGGGNEGYKVLKGRPWKLEEEFCPSFFSVVCDHLMRTRKPEFVESYPRPEHFEHLRPRVEGRVEICVGGNDSQSFHSDSAVVDDDQ